MTKSRIPKLDDVNKIVINKIAVWEYKYRENIWHKVDGGFGFNIDSKNNVKTPDQMRSFVSKKLSQTHNIKVFENWNTIVFEDKIAYRYWISEETLNIAMRSF